METKFRTEIVSLESLDDFNFSIPTYQRPYVWGDEQLKKLLDDFYNSYKQSSESQYYVSTFMTKEEKGHAELIDGQQRFTSLWLIAFVISKMTKNSAITKFLKKGSNLRLLFEIRKEVSDFLEALLEEESFTKKVFTEDYIVEYPYLKNIAKALVYIKGYLNQKPAEEIESFGNYIYKNVRFVKNTTADNTDLNKLFSTINSSGVQLEQTDIVKANLLRIIDEKLLFSRIWEACEEMNDFFFRNARNSFSSSNWSKINFNDLVQFDKTKFLCSSADGIETSEDFKIDDFDLSDAPNYNKPLKHSDRENRDSEEVYCRSIINFGQLLLHTYRLHLKRENLKDFEGTFHVNRLIAIFHEMEERNNPEEVKRFFHLLWDVRYIFDKYIIKWISDIDAKTETLELVNFNRNQESYYSRSNYAKSPSLMLQSVLYFTGDYLRQYWLTTYLNYLLEHHKNLSATDKLHLDYLEKIDNIFSTTDSLNDKDLSWNLMFDDNLVLGNVDYKNYLQSSLGTKFKHYWFQKLEYILWKNWEFEKTKEFDSFRIQSRNSVEHIYPQNPEENSKTVRLENDSDLNSFGNLVLLSVSQNSEYSRKSFNEKKGLFFNKGGAYDTLKSYYIFKYDKWNPEYIEDHQSKMIKKLEDHYQQ